MKKKKLLISIIFSIQFFGLLLIIYKHTYFMLLSHRQQTYEKQIQHLQNKYNAMRQHYLTLTHHTQIKKHATHQLHMKTINLKNISKLS